jgi:transposase
MLAKSVHDAGLSQFLRILADKVEETGRLLVAVNPAGTTQRCSACGMVVPKTLSDRWHRCACGLELGRDHNAARNILHLAQALGWSVQAPTVGVPVPLPEKPPALAGGVITPSTSKSSSSGRCAASGIHRTGSVTVP